MKGGAFSYFSPHSGDWWNPENERTYQNVLLSGAITNFPFLKGMQPISFNEFKEGQVAEDAVAVKDFTALQESVTALANQFASDFKRGMKKKLKAGKMSEDEKKDLIDEIKASTLSDDDKGEMVKLAEEVELEEVSDTDKDKKEKNDDDKGEENKEFTELKASNAATEKKLTEANTKIEKIERRERSVRFMEIIAGAGDNSAWTGKADKHLSLMESLAESFGEDSDQFKDYVSIQDSHAKQIDDAKLFGEEGSSQDGSSTESDELTSGVKKLMEADPKMTLASATIEWIDKNPKAYAKSDKAHMDRVRSSE